MENENISKVKSLTNQLNDLVEKLAYKADNDINELSFGELLSELKERLLGKLGDANDYNKDFYEDLANFCYNNNVLPSLKREYLIETLTEYHQEELTKKEFLKLDNYIYRWNKNLKSVDFFIKRTDLHSFKNVIAKKDKFVWSEIRYKISQPQEDYRPDAPYVNGHYFKITFKYKNAFELMDFTSAFDFPIYPEGK